MMINILNIFKRRNLKDDLISEIFEQKNLIDTLINKYSFDDLEDPINKEIFISTKILILENINSMVVSLNQYLEKNNYNKVLNYRQISKELHNPIPSECNGFIYNLKSNMPAYQIESLKFGSVSTDHLLNKEVITFTSFYKACKFINNSKLKLSFKKKLMSKMIKNIIKELNFYDKSGAEELSKILQNVDIDTLKFQSALDLIEMYFRVYNEAQNQKYLVYYMVNDDFSFYVNFIKKCSNFKGILIQTKGI